LGRRPGFEADAEAIKGW